MRARSGDCRRVWRGWAGLAAGLGALFAGATAVAAPLGPLEVRCQGEDCAVGRCVMDRLLDLEQAARTCRIVPWLHDDQPHGVKLFAIRPDSPLWALGLRNGDGVTALNGRTLRGPSDALKELEPIQKARRFTADLERQGVPFKRLVHADAADADAGAGGGTCPATAPVTVAAGSAPLPVPPPPRPPGSPLLDAALLARVRCDARGCAIPRAVLDAMLADSAFTRGARAAPVTRDGQVTGFRLYGLAADAALTRLGFRNGDEITRVGGRPFTSAGEALAVYTAVRTASEIPVELLRAGKQVTRVYKITP